MRIIFLLSAVVLILSAGCQRSSPSAAGASATAKQPAPEKTTTPAVPPADNANPPQTVVETGAEKETTSTKQSAKKAASTKAEQTPADSTASTTPPAPTDATAKGDQAAAATAPATTAPATTAPATTAPATADAATSTSDPTDSLPNPTAKNADALASSVGGKTSAAIATPAGTGSTPAAKPDKATNEAKQRVLLLSPGGPLVIDVVLQFGEGNFATALDRLVDEAFRTADSDGDGKATWSDVAQNPRFLSGQFGNLVADTEEERRQLIRIYDTDNDGQVDRDELPRFLTRNVGGGKSFSLRSSNQYRSSNRRRSPTRLLIDDDHDGAITAEEMEQAPSRLLARDADDDGVVVLAELKEQADEMIAQPPMMSNKRRVTEPDTAVWLTDKSVDMSKRWGMVQFQLQELYSYGEHISVSDWPMTPELFRAVDADGDGHLAKTELTRLLEVPPHMVLEITFDVTDEKSRQPRIKAQSIVSELAAWKPDLREYPSRLSIGLPSVEIEFFVNEDPSLSNAMQVVDAQFMALDRNQNGYLEKEELPEMTPGFEASFESLDTDKDGKVYKPELMAYIEQRSSVTRAQVRARAADQEDALFTALDTDGDGRMNAREMRLSPAKLNSLDVNADGKLQSQEIPGSMVLAFVRGNPQQDDQYFAYPAASGPGGDDSTPRWFRGMDENQDGEISLREFFGTNSQFEQLDADRDGFISREESKAAGSGK